MYILICLLSKLILKKYPVAANCAALEVPELANHYPPLNLLFS